MITGAAFQLEAQTVQAGRVNESKAARSEAWRAILLKVPGNATTTSKLGALMEMETKAAYRAVKAMAKEGLLSIISPEKSGQPCTIIINPKVRIFKNERSHI